MKYRCLFCCCSMVRVSPSENNNPNNNTNNNHNNRNNNNITNHNKICYCMFCCCSMVKASHCGACLTLLVAQKPRCCWSKAAF